MHHHPSFVYASNRMNHKSYVASDCSTPTRRQLTTSRLQSTNADSNGHDLAVSHYDEVIPFLSEHIQKSDQMLLLGASTDFSLKLVKDGFGVAKTGYMVVVDEDQANIDKLSQAIAQDAELSKYQQDGKLKLIATDFTNMPQVCRQSVFDSIVDYCAMDKLLRRPNGKECFLKCVDHLQNSLRLGNLLVCISKEDKELFTEPFEERFGKFQLLFFQKLYCALYA